MPRFLLQFMWDMIGPFSQNIFVAFRFILLKNLVQWCGDNVYIGKNVTLKNGKLLSIGSNVSIHDNCYIDAYGGVNICDNVSIAHNCSILSTNHTYNNPDLPIKYNVALSATVTIEEDVWVGCGARILAGVTIASHCVIAAGAVVNRSCESNSIFGGVPAKKIKSI